MTPPPASELVELIQQEETEQKRYIGNGLLLLWAQWRPGQGPMEKARLSQAQGQNPRQEPGLCSVTRLSCAFLAVPCALWLAGGMAVQAEKRAWEERLAALGPVPEHLS